MTEPISVDISTREGTVLEQCMVPGNNTPGENASGAKINLQGTAAEQPTNNAMYVSLAAVPDKDMDEPRGEQLDASKEKNMELLLGHLQEFLVSPPASAVIGVENHHSSSIRGSLVLDEIDQSCMVPNAEDCQPPVNTPSQSDYNCTVGNIQLPLIDSFIESILKPIAQPILQTHNSAVIGLKNLQASPQSCPAKRQSTRLAQKAANNVGKGTIQIAHELLVKKLGDLSGETQEHISDEFEFYA